MYTEIYLHTIHAYGNRYRAALFNTIWSSQRRPTYRVRGGNGTMLVCAILDARRRSFAIVVVVKSDQCLLATPPAPNRAGVPPNPRNDALHPSRRRIASLSPT